jgi:ACT domain-containing protein
MRKVVGDSYVIIEAFKNRGVLMMCPKEKQSQERDSQRVIVTVVGVDKVGIIAGVSGVLADYRVNILDISQTILRDFFTMIMIVDISQAVVDLQKLQYLLKEKGEEIGVQIKVQHEDIFKFMHRI